MSQIREVKEAVDIVDVIGSKVALQRSGSSLKGLCPFHNEKTPSFFVSEELQRYKCFGCGRDGDVFTFLQEYEGMTFYEALQSLAEQAGIKLETSAPSREDRLRTEVLEALDLAKEYYHYLLTDHKVGQPARDYLLERGTSQQSIKLFQLGAAPKNWDELIKYLHGKKKYSLEALEKAGLVIRNNRDRHYDRFRHRIIFPLKNHRGQVVGFSGRKLPDPSDKQSEKDAKYINTPETAVYHKSELLFGFSELKQQIRQKKQVIVVEGEFDVISSQQVHISHIVAIKGSALTAQHVKMLSRSVDQVMLSLDADSAGIEATKKAIKVVNKAEEAGSSIELRVIRLPEGKDPDELARNNPTQWRDLVKKSVTAYEFLIDAAFAKHDAKQPSGKNKIMAEILPVLASINHAVELEHYQKLLSSRLEVSTSSVQADLDSYLRKNSSKVSKLSRRGSGQNSDKQSSPTPKPLSKKDALEKYLWFLLLHSEPADLHKRALQLGEVELSLPGSQQIIKAINDTLEDASLADIAKNLPDDLQQKVFELYSSRHLLSDIEKIDLSKEWKSAFKQFQELVAADKIREIEVELEQLDRVDDKSEEQIARQEELLRQLVTFRK